MTAKESERERERKYEHTSVSAGKDSVYGREKYSEKKVELK